MMNTAFRKRMFVVCLSTAMLGLAAASAKATTIFTNLGTGGSFSNTSFFAVGNFKGEGNNLASGMLFMPLTTANLTDAVLALGNLAGDNNTLTVDLESDNSGQPGAILATFTQQGTIAPSSSPGLVTFDCSGTCPTLTSGTAYWLVATETDPNSSQGWFFSNSDVGTVVTNNSGSATGPWQQTFSGQTISAFQVDGAPVTTTATPEPASLLLFGTGLLGAAILMRRREKHRAAGESAPPAARSMHSYTGANMENRGWRTHRSVHAVCVTR